MTPVGVSPIPNEVKDDCGNIVDPTPTVTYSGSDQTDPTVTCSNFTRTVNNTTECNYLVGDDEFDPPASDNCSYTLVNDLTGTATLEGHEFAVGIHTIDWTVTDAAGNENACSSIITINPFLVVSVTIAANPSGPICAGTSVDLYGYP